MSGVADAWTATLAELTHTSVTVDDVIIDVRLLMSTYGLASYDAVHAATALRDHAVGIVTTDVGFCSLPETTAIFTDGSRVGRGRQIRARR